MNNIKKTGFGIALLGLLCGCGTDSANLSILEANENASASTLALNKLDILFVIDNSGSMLTKQQNLANSFESFVNTFQNKNFDFNIAIITTDIDGGGQDGDFQGTPAVLTSSTSNFANIFKTNVVVGATGSAAAKAMGAIELALSTSKLASTNAGFLRNDAHLAIVILSDSDDFDSSITDSQLLTFLDGLKPATTSSSGSKLNYSISAVIAKTSFGNCAAPFDDGDTFVRLASATDGETASICESDFSTGLVNLSSAIAESATSLLLDQVPDTTTISVTFNDTTTIPEDSVNGWRFDANSNRIIFSGSFLPDDGTTIAVRYIPEDIIR